MGKENGTMTNVDTGHDLGELSSTPKRKSTRTSVLGPAGQLTWSTVETTTATDAQPITPPCNRLPSSGASWRSTQYAMGSSSSSSVGHGSNSGASGSGLSRLGSSSGGESGATPKWFLGSPRVQQLRVTESTKRDSVLEFDFKGMHFSRHSAVDGQSVATGSEDIADNECCLPTPSMVAATTDAMLSRTAHKSNNPFEGDHWLETMHLSSFSPSVFTKVVTPSKDHEFGHDTFSWGLENAAMLYPNEFEESQHQNVSTPCDHEREKKIQKQIDAYFSKNNCVPSPWLLSNAKNMDFSPHPAYTVQIGSPAKETTEQKTSVPVITCNASTQTTLTLPNNFDLEKILACYFTYNGFQNPDETAELELDTKESLSNSSLRRKLFVNDDSLASPRNSSKCTYSSALATNDDGESSPAMHLRAYTPENRENGATDSVTSLSMDFVSPDGSRNGRAQCHSLSPSMAALSPNVSPIHTGGELEDADRDDDQEDNDCVSMMSIGCSQPNTPQPNREQKRAARECNRSLDLQDSSNRGCGTEQPIADNYPMTDGGPSWHELMNGAMPSTIYMETSSSAPNIQLGIASSSSTTEASSSSSTGPDTGYHTMSGGALSLLSSTAPNGQLNRHQSRTPDKPSITPPGGCLWVPLGASTPSRALVTSEEPFS